MDGSLPFLERALLPGEGHLMWARLAHLILLVRQGHFKEAAGPLDALVAETAQRRPKDRKPFATALKWRAKAVWDGGAECGKWARSHIDVFRSRHTPVPEPRAFPVQVWFSGAL
jgi:hypothetical protein